MKAFRIKNTKNDKYLKDDSLELEWVSWPHLVIYGEAKLQKLLRLIGVKNDWIEYEEFPPEIVVEHFEMSPIGVFDYRTTLMHFEQIDERRYNAALRTLGRLQKRSEESLNICE